MSFEHFFQPAADKTSKTLVLLHGTGGSEHDLIRLGRQIAPGAALLSPRGKISEGGARRFFRRFAEGVLDIEDWKEQSHDLAAFIQASAKKHGLDTTQLYALGYSNGANIALGLLLLHPELLAGAALLRPMFITDDLAAADLSGKKVLLLSGEHDPLVPHEQILKLHSQLKYKHADIELHRLNAGHPLVEEDLKLSIEWFNR